MCLKEHTKMEKRLYRLRFEPEDVEAYSPDEAIIWYNVHGKKPDIRKVYLVDKDGLPLA